MRHVGKGCLQFLERASAECKVGLALRKTLICLVNASLFTRIEHNRLRYLRFYVEVSNVDIIQSVVDKLNDLLHNDVYIDTIPAKSGIVGNVGLEVTTTNKNDFDRVKKELSSIEGINYIVQ